MSRLTDKRLYSFMHPEFFTMMSKDKEERWELRELERNKPDYRDLYMALAAYEDAEEQGLLVRLPCKVGDTVWVITNVFNGFGTEKRIGSRPINQIRYNEINGGTMVSLNPYELHFYPSEIGKTVFFTRAEAEAALEAQK